MTDSESPADVLFGEAPLPNEARLRAQLAAVELLLARPDRDIAHHDILIATALELLGDGPLTTAQLMARVAESWPGLRLLTSELEAALDAAAAVQNLRRVVLHGSLEAWELLPAGRTELDQSSARGAEIIDRFRSQIGDELRRRTGECRIEDLNPVADVVTGAIRAAVGRFFEVKEAGQIENAGGWLRIRGAEALDVERWISDRTTDPERVNVVTSISLAALDQSISFGSEMVHHLVTGHLLYLFMARPDEVLATTTAGPLTGEVLIVDTPIVFRLADESRLRQPVLELLVAAKNGGMRVVLGDGTMAEFERHLKALETHEVLALDQTLRQGASPSVLAGLQRQTKVLNIWLRWAARQPAATRSWADFRSYLAGVEGPANLLSAIGVEVNPPTQTGAQVAQARVGEIRAALVEQISLSGARERGESAIDHDALMLAAIRRVREQNPTGSAKVWPGGFCLTTDRQLDEVYVKVFGDEPFPVTLTTSQLAQIVGAYTDPRVSEALALKVAGGLLDSELVKRTAAIPVELAQLMAMSVAEESPTDIEVEQLELDLRRALDESRHRLETGSIQHDELVRQIAESRRIRKRSALEQAERAASDERHRVDLELTRRDEQIRAADQREAELRASAKAGESKLVASSQAHDEERASWLTRNCESRRKHGVDLGVVAAFGLAVALFVGGETVAAIALGIGASFVWIYGHEWATGRSSTKMLVAGLLTSIATVVPVVVSMISSDDSNPPTSPTLTPDTTTTPEL